MSAKARNKLDQTPRFGQRNARPRLLISLIALIFSILIAIALFDYHPEQNVAFQSDITDTNLVGQFGVWIGYYTLLCIGMAAYALPCFLLWFAYMYFRPFGYMLRVNKYALCLVLFISLAVFSAMNQAEWHLQLPEGPAASEDVASNLYPYGWGGWTGFTIYDQFLREFLGMVGSMVVFGVLTVFALTFILYDNVGVDLQHVFKVKINEWAIKRAERSKERAEKRAIKKAEKEARIQQKQLAKKAAEAKAAAERESAKENEATQKTVAVPPKKSKTKLSFGRAPQVAPKAQNANAKPFDPIIDDDPDDTIRIPQNSASNSNIEEGSDEFDDDLPPFVEVDQKKKAALSPSSSVSAGLRIIASEQTRKANIKLPQHKGNYSFPSLDLLTEPVSSNEDEDSSIHQQTAEMLIQTLDEFGVKVTPGEVHTGPVITRYDVYPAAGVRVERILNLDKNIALGLKATSVRILAPVPGKGCVGIEVPNQHPQSVFIRDILESEDWVNSKAEIPIALGKEVSGKPLIADLTKMPHLLIAGSTGSGKTVCINSIICSLLYKASPEDLRFVMVDPKIVEMQVYNQLPHMLVPVVTDPKKVPNALKYLLNEMESRYQTFARVGVRNIAGYNAKMAKNRKDAEDAEEKAAALDAELTPEERAATSLIEVPRDPGADKTALPTKLPYIVCIVDELADLMMVAPADIETGIARLAQLARAAGIHLILATQRPSVNVITGVIKANLPSRISFKVASKVDSRTILDTMGADHLIGKGDMLFLPPGSADLLRAQGAFVGDDEITGIVEQIARENGEPMFDEQFQKNIESGTDENGSSSNGEDADELMPQAIEVIKTSKRASTSMLQRRLKIGYNRAARIMEQLEDDGVVGPENGSSPREILIDTD